MNSVEDFRRRMPMMTYEDHQPYIARVLQGETTALFAPGTRVLMFAMTSGTTGEPKRLPITEELFREYRAGWRHVGRRRLRRPSRAVADQNAAADQRLAALSCARRRPVRTNQRAGGVDAAQDCAAVCSCRRPSRGEFTIAAAKHYTALRLALATNRVGMIITANPSTLVEFARRADQQRESLIRDIHDGTLSCDLPAEVRAALARRIGRRNPKRARELEQLAETHGALLPKHAWPRLKVLAVWTGGSVGVFLPQLAELYGDSRGARSRAVGQRRPHDDSAPTAAAPASSTSITIISSSFRSKSRTASGPRCSKRTSWRGSRLLHPADHLRRTVSLRHSRRRAVRRFRRPGAAAGIPEQGQEFLQPDRREAQRVSGHRAVQRSFRELGLPIDTFTLGARDGRKPRYVLLVEPHVHQGRDARIGRSVQAHLERVNEEYAGKVRERAAAAGSNWRGCRPARGTNCGGKRPASAAISRSTSIRAW